MWSRRTTARPPTKAYFDSCSDGGREALMEAQRFPGGLRRNPGRRTGQCLDPPDVDRSRVLPNLRSGDPRAYISSLKLPAIQRACTRRVRRIGRGERRVSSTIRRNATLIRRCCCARSANSLDCLTQPQVNSLQELYAGGDGGTPSSRDIPWVTRRRLARSGSSGRVPGRAPEFSMYKTTSATW